MNTEFLIEVLEETNKIKIKPLKQWYCDQCRKVIDSPEVGWLEWLSDINRDKEHSFRIVHHDRRCIYPAQELHSKGFLTKDMHLTHYVGPDGLNNLLDILLRKNIDQNEVVKVIRRLHVPYFEQSLLYRGKAETEGYFLNNPDSYVSVRENLDLIDKYE